MKNKKLVRITDTPYINIDRSFFEGEIEEVAKKIAGLKDEIHSHIIFYEDTMHYKLTPIKEYKKISIETRWNGEDSDFELICEREETDEEYEKRINAELGRKKAAKIATKKRKEEKEKKEKELFEKLKKKYGN
jgi:hypothetical protein